MWVSKGGGAAGRVLLAAMSLAGVLCIGARSRLRRPHAANGRR